MDSIFFPPDTFITTNAHKVSEFFNNRGINTIATVKKMVEKGALFGLVSDYEKLGRMAAQIIHEHQQGKNLHEIPVKIDENPVLFVNRKTLEKHAIKFPVSQNVKYYP